MMPAGAAVLEPKVCGDSGVIGSPEGRFQSVEVEINHIGRNGSEGFAPIENEIYSAVEKGVGVRQPFIMTPG